MMKHCIYFDMGNERSDDVFQTAVNAAMQTVLDRRIPKLSLGFLGEPTDVPGLPCKLMLANARQWPGTSTSRRCSVSYVYASTFGYRYDRFLAARRPGVRIDDPFLFEATDTRWGVVRFGSVMHERIAWCWLSDPYANELARFGFQIEARDPPKAERLASTLH